jgi:minor extracellular serine protease Vpr
MSRRRAPLLVLAAAMLVLALGASAGAATLSGGSRNESFRAWFVQFKTAPVAKGGSKAALASERAAFFKNAADQGLSVTQRFAFDQLWNGVSVSIPASQAGGLSTVPGVANVYPVTSAAIAADGEGADGEVALPAGTADPNLVFATTMTQAQSANTAGWTGAGIKVAIIDSGFDWKNPDLNPSLTFPGDRIAGGFDFVGDDYDANENDSTFQPVPHPDNDPAPCDPNVADARAAQPGAGVSAAGHGTHVAGIVGAKAAGPGGVTGVAPAVTFLAYRVFGCNGSTDSDIMAAAMERAYEDGAQVVNMSIGSAFVNHPESPTAVAADALADKGVVVVTSIGNSGASGLYSAGAPGVGNKVIGVASVQNLALPALTFNVTSGGTTRQVPYLQLQAAQTAPTSGTSGDGTIVNVGRGCVADPTLGLAVDDPYLADPNGKIALIVRGVCTFATKYHRAVAAGAKAVIIMNDGANPGRVGLFAGGGVLDEGVPGVTISFTDGEAIKALAAPRNLTWTDVRVNAADPAAGTISDFSSWGTDSHLGLKPDISAPGGNITSTWPMQQFGGHNTISGTSMASPHVAGAAALLLQAGIPAAQIRDRLQNSSVPFANVATGVTEATQREGAGLVQILNAIQAPVRVAPGKISFGQGNGGSSTLTLTNSTGSDVTYALAHTTALAVGPTATTQYPFTFGFFAANPVVTFTQGGAPVASVTVPANGSTQVTVSIVPPGYPAKTLWGGYVRFTQSGVTRLRVPYGAFMGDYQSIVAVGNGGCNLPMLVKIGGAGDSIDCPAPTADIQGLIGQPAGGVWDRPKQDPIVLLYHLDHQVAAETITLVDAATGQPVSQGGRVAALESNTYLPRNSQPTSFFAFIWDGTQAFTTGNGKVQRKAAPGGVYKLKFTITKVKALNDSGAAGTETWMSPAFTLRDG